MTLSIVVPAYNAAASLPEALESVAAQTWSGEFEIVVVNDGSSDETERVARAAFRRLGLERAKILTRERAPGSFSNAGIARNAGIEAATGAYVAFLDADDVWYPEKLQRSMSRLASDPSLIAVCHDESMVQDGRSVGVHRSGTRLPLYWSLLLYDNCLSTSATVARRDALERAGGFSEDPAHHSVEDYHLWIRLARLGPIGFIREVLGEYRIAAEALHSDPDLHVSSKLNVIDDAFDRQFGASPAGWRGLLRRQRRMRAIQDVAWECRAGGDMHRALVLARRALAEWPLSPKLWAVSGVIRLEAARQGGRARTG